MINGFVKTTNYEVGDLVKINVEIPVHTYDTEEAHLDVFVRKTQIVLDEESTIVGIIYKIIEDDEYGYGEITFMVGNEMYYTEWWGADDPNGVSNRPMLTISESKKEKKC